MTRVALVTGAARGIGAATVARLDRDGWAIVAVDRCADDPRLPYALGTAAQLDSVVGACADAVAVQADVTDLDAMRAAALVVRRSVLTDGFDPALRYGEDVDFVWRLNDDGWRVRYEPAVTVRHAEPRHWRALLRRRWHYGTSAAPLAERHPGRLAPLVAHPWPATIALLLLARRPRTAGAVALVQSWTTARRLRSAGLPAPPTPVWAARGVAQTVVATGHAATTIAPLLLVAGVRRRRPAPLLPVVAHAGSSNAAAPATPVVPTCRIGGALRRARGYVQQVARTVARPIPSGRRPEPHQRPFRTPSSGSPDRGISPPTIG